MTFVTKFRFHNQGTCNRNNFHARRNWNVQSLELIFNAKLTCPINSPIIPFECWLRIRNDSHPQFCAFEITVIANFSLKLALLGNQYYSTDSDGITSVNFFFYILRSIIHSFFGWLVFHPHPERINNGFILIKAKESSNSSFTFRSSSFPRLLRRCESELPQLFRMCTRIGGCNVSLYVRDSAIW